MAMGAPSSAISKAKGDPQDRLNEPIIVADAKRKGRPDTQDRPSIYALPGHKAQSLVVVPAAIILIAVVATVTIAVIPACIAIVVAIAGFALDPDFKPLDTPLDLIAFPIVQAIAGSGIQSALEVARFVAKATGFTLAQDIAAVEAADLALKLVDADLKTPNLAIVIVAIGISLRRWRPLGGCRRRGNEGRSDKRGGNNELTHLALSLRTVDAQTLKKRR